MSGASGGPASEEVKLHYLDTLTASYQMQAAAQGRMLRLLIPLSLLLLALASGLVSAGDDIEITGVKLKLQLSLVLGGGAVLIAMLWTGFALLDLRLERLQDTIVSRYEALGIAEAADHHDQGIILASHPLDLLTARDSAAGYSRVGAATVLAVALPIILLPLAAQIAVLVKLGIDIGWIWYMLLPLGGALALSTSVVLWAVVKA